MTVVCTWLVTVPCLVPWYGNKSSYHCQTDSVAVIIDVVYPMVNALVAKAIRLAVITLSQVLCRQSAML